MKKQIITTLILIMPMIAIAGEDFEKAMAKAIETMFNSSDVAEYLEAANRFDRISSAEQEEWLPSYYAAFCYTMIATRNDELERADEYLDKADEYLVEGLRRNGDKVELLAMQGFTTMLRISVDPTTRGQEYSMKTVQYLQQAAQIDPNNPRVVLMMAQIQYGTAQFFGAGTTEPCNNFRKAIELFEQSEATDQGIKPSWGKHQAISMLKNCEG